MDILTAIREYKVVSIARRVPESKIVEVARALYEGGIRLIEITFDQSDPDCLDKTFNAIASVNEALCGKLRTGAGTVLTAKQAEVAYEAGAEFVLAPNTDADVIKKVKDLGMAAVPGAFTPTEILAAWNAGADIVKLFPAGILGLPYLRAIRGPISHVPLMAVGGVNENNFREFLSGGFCSCGIGSNLIVPDLVKKGDYEGLSRIAARFADCAGQ